ncbi:MAG: alpha/beta fold hydrolase [Polyangiaceae bacterium]|nr:alpha/beta fold hydrolase [Polyangiaceae bacterium]
MGYIHKALDVRLEREVAIKVALEPIPSDPTAMLREARALAALNNANVVTVYEVGVHEGCAYIVMELLRGETLRARIERAPPSLMEALSWACDVLRGLSAAHDARIMHLDLKPENVFITRDGSLKLIDFGVGGQRRTGMHEQDKIAGTIAYMAPEQLLGDVLDFRADLFAFGILLHELVTGRHPFQKPKLAATMFALVHGEFFIDGEIADPEVKAVIQACMALEPAARPASAAAVLEELERLLRERAQVPAPSQTAYAETEHGHVAFQCIGAPRGTDLLLVPGLLSRFDAWSQGPEGAAFLRALSDAGRVALFDRSGFGSSDRMSDTSLPCLDEEIDHIDAVLDAASAARVVLLALGTGAPLAALYAAVRPERVAGLIIYAGAPCYTDAETQVELAARAEDWGTERNGLRSAPSFAKDTRALQWLSSWERATASRKTARAWVSMIGRADAGAALPFITQPTLILRRKDDRLCPPSQTLAFAAGIAGSEHVVLPGEDHLPCAGAADVAPHVVRFARACAAAPRLDDAGSLATWLLTDVRPDQVPACLHPRFVLERGSLRVMRVDRPGAAMRTMREALAAAPSEGKAVIACSARGASPEEVLAEVEPLFVKAPPGAVVATSIARFIIDGTTGLFTDAEPRRSVPDVAATPTPLDGPRAPGPEVAGVANESSSIEAVSGPRASAGALMPRAAEKKTARVVSLFAVGFVAVTAFGYLALSGKDLSAPQAAPPITTAAPPAKSELILTLDSIPGGATVKEGGKDVGTTPMAITLNGNATEARVFTLSLAGYRDYTFRQEPATADVAFTANLTKLEPPPVTSATAASVVKRHSGRSPSGATTAAVAASAAPEPPRPGDALDIKLKR